MNKAEEKARQLYKANSDKVASGEITNVIELSNIAKQQDRLYMVFNERSERSMKSVFLTKGVINEW